MYVAIPSSPLNITITNKTYQSVNLSWAPPIDTGGYATVNYIIMFIPFNCDNNLTTTTITTDSNITSYIITGLMFGTTYNFAVRANNGIGQGESSSAVTAATLPGESNNINSHFIKLIMY